MKAIALTRVSTAIQDLQQQTDAVINEIIKDGYNRTDIILIENIESAIKLDEYERQGLNKMKSAIESDPNIDSVYIYELSRLSRRPQVLYSVRDYLIEKKIQLVVLKPAIRLFDGDRINEAASIMFAIFGSMAEQEMYIKKERFQRAKRKNKLSGRWAGGFLPIGYTHDENFNLIVDDEKAEIVRNVFKDYLYKGKSTSAIAIDLYQMGVIDCQTADGATSTVRKMLKNIAYIGKSPFNIQTGQNVYNQYPRIIDDETFERTQELLHSRTRLPKTRHKYVYYLKNIIFDNESGTHMNAVPCTACYSTHIKRFDGSTHSQNIPINMVDSFAWHLTKEYSAKHDDESTKKIKTENNAKLMVLEKKIENAKRKIQDLNAQELKIQKRIIEGKLKESMGDDMINSIVENIEIQNNNLVKYQIEYDDCYSIKLRYAGRQIQQESMSEITNDDERRKLILETIKRVNVIKKPIAEGEIKHQCKGVVEIIYFDGVIEKYSYKSFTRRFYDESGKEVEYEYLNRIPRTQRKKTV